MANMNMVIGDRITAAASGQTFGVVSPVTEEIHAYVPEAGPEDVDLAVRSARESFDRGPWRRMLPPERGRLLNALADLVEKNAEPLARLDTEDMGKPFTHSRLHDVPGAVSFLRFYAGLPDKIRGSQIPCGPDKHIYTVREPVGVVAGILPWNFPFVVAVQKLAPALACGNTLVLKPAEQSPRSAILLAQLCLEAGFPPGVVNVVTGAAAAGASLAAHPQIDKISFTGSTEVGRKIMHAAADQIRKVTLELGGKTANIIFPDADMDAAVASCLLTSCYNSGQICTSASRLLLHPGIHDPFMESLLAAMGKLKVGDPWEEDTKLGPLVSREQHDRVKGYIAAGEKSYRAYRSGRRSATLSKGFFVDPIVFDHVPAESTIAQEEIFGPVLSAIDFADEEDAVRVANSTTYGLATAIWTRDLSRAHRLSAAMDSGFVWINCNNFWIPQIPYEGHRQSGIGADMGVEAVESYTRLKNTVINLSTEPNPWALG